MQIRIYLCIFCKAPWLKRLLYKLIDASNCFTGCWITSWPFWQSLPSLHPNWYPPTLFSEWMIAVFEADCTVKPQRYDKLLDSRNPDVFYQPPVTSCMMYEGVRFFKKSQHTRVFFFELHVELFSIKLANALQSTSLTLIKLFGGTGCHLKDRRAMRSLTPSSR